jgi:hypothetical protein
MTNETLEQRVARIAKQELIDNDGLVPIEATVWALIYGDDRIELCNRSGAFKFKSTLKQLRVACVLLKQMIKDSQ